MQNLHIIARIVVYSLWIWVFYFDGLHLTLAMRSLVNFIVIADLITWVIYQIYLLPRFLIHFGVGALLNLIVIAILLKGVQSILPQTADLQAMAVMVFLSMSGVKGMYYFMLEMERSRSQ